MYLLVHKTTKLIEDVQSQPFPVTEDFEWVESNVEREEVIKKLYDKKTGEITEPVRVERPPEISNRELLAKIEALEQKADSKEVLGVSEVENQTSVWFPVGMVLVSIIIIFIAVFRKRV